MEDFFLAVFGLFIVGPIRSIRLMRRGSERVTAFRRQHGRSPTEPELRQISLEVYEEIHDQRVQR